MKRCSALLSLLLFALVVGGTSHAAWIDVTSEEGVDRPGQDYKTFTLWSPDPKLCRQACERDERCKAYTYKKPISQAHKAVCRLKDGVPSAKKDDWCVSGVKLIRSPTMSTAQMAAPPVRGTQVAPKVQAHRFSPRASDTGTPPHRSPSTAKKGTGEQTTHTHPSTTKKGAGDQDATDAVSRLAENKKKTNVRLTRTPSPVVMGNEVIYKREPFSIIKHVKIKSGKSLGLESITVSDEHLLVIETISASCVFKLGQKPHRLRVQTSLGHAKGALIIVPLSKRWETDSGTSMWNATQQVRAYAAPGSDVKLVLERDPYDTTNTKSGVICSCSLYGYQIDPDSPSLAP